MIQNLLKNQTLPLLLAVGMVLSLFAFMTPRAEAATKAPAKQSKDCLKKANSKPSLKVSGDQAVATFTIPKDCLNQKVTLASYTAPNGTDGQPYSKQQIYRWVTYTYPKAGKYTLKVSVPKCFYQVDLARGGVIEKFSKGNTYAQNGDLLASEHGGNKSCEQPKPQPVAPTTPAPVKPVDTEPDQPVQKVVCNKLTAYPMSSKGKMPATYKFGPSMSGQQTGMKSYDFGDGNATQTSGAMAEHTYTQPGIYAVSMKVAASDSKQAESVTCNTNITIVEQKEVTPVAPVEPVEPTPPAQQEVTPVATTPVEAAPVQAAPESTKLPDTGPGDIAALGFVWTFIGGTLFAYRGKFDTIVATLVSKLG